MSVYIIGEAGVNHNGDLDKAKHLALCAKQAGCDCVKYQTFKAEKIVTQAAPMAEYQEKNIGKKESQYQMLKKLELSYDDFQELYRYCREIEIDFLSSPFDEDSADFLDSLGVSAFKISSGEITNKLLLRHVAQKGKRVFLSTGMSDMDEVEQAVSWIYSAGNKNVVLFHCTSNYPAAYESVNMKAMLVLKEKFQCPVGYSDHTAGIEIPIFAAALGAQVIEKHFTYDKNAEGPDHKASLSPDELTSMVKSIRHIEAAVGDGKKVPSKEELATRELVRKSLAWKVSLPKGHVVTPDDICCLRPGIGLPPVEFENMIGKTTIRNCAANTLVAREDINQI
ncbi:MAG: N-acetylneuraminate synthase [Lachnospiraceae bacterium]|nr:N-acetylneuraminate synthase [Lachnospiraceae bacterium]